MKKKVIAIVGATASGKSNLAIKIAQKLGTEIISADSRQIYCGFKIACASPAEEELNLVRHHLVNFVEPDFNYSVANFVDDSKKIMENLINQNKIPVVVGGTGLYFRMLLENFDMPRVAPNQLLRDELEKKDADELYKMLQARDEISANKIHKNNKVKIIRALEVIDALNMPMSEAQGLKEPEYDVLWLGLDAKNREFLYDRINLRVDKMFEMGIVDETKNLCKKYGQLPIFDDTIGYSELIKYFSGECSFEEAKESIKQNTRRYAKRQLTWFRRNKLINWFYIDELSEDEIYNLIVEKYFD